ncbi:MAG: pilus assembly PilX family protein [Gammaproteobacteria bacterium]
MSMHYPTSSFTRQRGVALIIALILLMVLTMIAVVAMRTTTLDLRMATNQTIVKRTFNVSESARMDIHDTLDSHTFYRGWPDTITGGTVPAASTGFTIPPELLIDDNPGLQQLYLTNNADHWDLRDAAIDIRLRQDGDSPADGAFDSVNDMAADIFVSRITAVAAPGSDTSQVTGYEGLGAGAAGAGSRLYYRMISRAAGIGASQATTDALYRYVITN